MKNSIKKHVCIIFIIAITVFFATSIQSFAEETMGLNEHISINDTNIAEISDVSYTGEPIMVDLNITYEGNRLEEGIDYKVEYSRNINVGNVVVTITGIGRFCESITRTFKITPVDVTGCFEWELKSWDFSKYQEYPQAMNCIKDNLIITLGGKTLVLEKDYAIGNAGYNFGSTKVASFRVIFKGNYTGEVKFESLESAIAEKIEDQHYTGEEIRPSLLVYPKNNSAHPFVEGEDYYIEYCNNINPGTATIKITPIGYNYGTQEVTFEITDHEYEWVINKKATLENDGQKTLQCKECKEVKEIATIYKIEEIIFEPTTYDGKYHTPDYIVKDSMGQVINNKYVFVAYTDVGLKVGTYRAYVSFSGEYDAKIVYAYYAIVPKAPSSASANLSTLTGGYDDIKFSWSKATGASGYNVYYKKSTSSSYTYLTRTTGTSVTKKDLTDGVKYNFKVVPYYKSGDTRYTSLSYKTASVYTLKKIAIPTVSKNGTKVKVKWTNINGETGYQISKSTKKTGTNVVATYKTTSGTYKNVSATKGKIYYYKVRAYKVVDGKKVFGPWSAVKSYKRK